MEAINPRIILLRVSGFGQKGEHAHRPGHDLNYIGMAGILSKFGQQDKAQFPNNYAADFAGCMFGITGTLAALLERQKTGLGQVVDCSLMHCSRYMGLPLSNYKDTKFVHTYTDSNQNEYITSFGTKQEQL
jgi:alpha-methylacyl-CoA racemase